MKQQLSDYGIVLDHILIKCGNTSAINVSKNPVLHSRTKHIEIRHHFIRDHVLKGDVVLEFVDTKNQLADIFTKPLNKDSFYNIRRELGMLDASDLSKWSILLWHLNNLVFLLFAWYVWTIMNYVIWLCGFYIFDLFMFLASWLVFYSSMNDLWMISSVCMISTCYALWLFVDAKGGEK